MKKLLLILTALALTGLSGPAFAQANEGWYAGVSVGSADQKDACTGLGGIGFVGSCDDTDTGWKIFGGLQFNKNWGVEFGFVDLGESTANGTVFGAPATAKAEIDGFTVFGTGTVPLGEAQKFALFGKLGLLAWSIDTSATVGGFPATISDDGVDSAIGIGLKYDFTERVGIRAEWESFIDVGDSATTGESDIDLITVGVVIWFGPKSAKAGSGKPTSSGKSIRCKGYGCPE